MEFLATVLVVLAIVIAVVTVVGHGIWMFLSCVFGPARGSMEGGRTAGREPVLFFRQAGRRRERFGPFNEMAEAEADGYSLSAVGDRLDICLSERAVFEPNSQLRIARLGPSSQPVVALKVEKYSADEQEERGWLGNIVGSGCCASADV